MPAPTIHQGHTVYARSAQPSNGSLTRDGGTQGMMAIMATDSSTITWDITYGGVAVPRVGLYNTGTKQVSTHFLDDLSSCVGDVTTFSWNAGGSHETRGYAATLDATTTLSYETKGGAQNYDEYSADDENMICFAAAVSRGANPVRLAGMTGITDTKVLLSFYHDICYTTSEGAAKDVGYSSNAHAYGGISLSVPNTPHALPPSAVIEVTMPLPTVVAPTDIIMTPASAVIEVTMPEPTISAPMIQQLPLVGRHKRMPGRVADPSGGLSVPVLSHDGVEPGWIEAPAGGDVATDEIWDAKGDLAGGTGADTAVKLVVGTNDQVLTADSGEATGMKWATPSAAGDVATDVIWDAKGDLAGGTGADTAVKLAVGTNDQVLTADSAEATGMKWAAAAGGSALLVQDESGTVSDAAVDTIRVPDGTLVDNGAGDVSLRTVPTGVIGASAYHDAVQSIPASTPTALLMDAEKFDTDSIHSVASNTSRLTVPAGLGGTWHVWGFAQLTAVTGQAFIEVVKNGSTGVSGRWGHADSAAGYYCVGSIDVELAAGDYIELHMTHTDAGAVNSGHASVYSVQNAFGMTKLGSGTVGEAIGAKAYMTSYQSNLTASTWVKVGFDATEFDTDSIFDDGNDRLTVPAGLGGKWLVAGVLALEGGSSAGALAGIYKNDSIDQYVFRGDLDEADLYVSFAQAFELEAGDYIELWANPGNASSVDVRGAVGFTGLSMILLSTQGEQDIPVAEDVIWDTKGDLAVATGADAAIKLAAGTNDYVLTADSGEATGLKWAAAAGGGDITVDPEFDAKGDIIGGTGDNTAARLAVGTNDHVLTADSAEVTGLKWAAAAGGGDPEVFVQDAEPSDPGQDALWVDSDGSATGITLVTGTTFPGAPSTGDMYRRSDLDYETYFYDGTRWVSETIYTASFLQGDVADQPMSANDTPSRCVIPYEGNVWLKTLTTYSYASAPLDASNYWTYTLRDQVDGYSTVVTWNSYAAGHSASTPTRTNTALDEVLDCSTNSMLDITVAKTGSAGSMRTVASLTYRKIAT